MHVSCMVTSARTTDVIKTIDGVMIGIATVRTYTGMIAMVAANAGALSRAIHRFPHIRATSPGSAARCQTTAGVDRSGSRIQGGMRDIGTAG